MQNEFKGLRQYIDIIEGKTQQVDEDANTAGNVAGQIASTAVNTVTAPPRAVWNGMKWVYDKAGDVANAAIQGTKNFAQGAYQGFTQGGIDPLAPIDSSKQAAASYNASGNQGAKAPTTPEEIKAFQKANGLTPDGIIGPKTLATMQAKGIKPAQATGQGATKTPAKPATKPATPAAAPAAATGTQATTDDEGNVTITQPDGTRKVVGPDGNVIPAGGGKVAPAAPAAQTPTMQNPLAGATPEQIKALGGANPLDPIIRSRMGLAPIPGLSEGTGYREEQSIARIVDLVNYRR